MDFLCIAPSTLKCYNCGLIQCEDCKRIQFEMENDLAKMIEQDRTSIQPYLSNYHE